MSRSRTTKRPQSGPSRHRIATALAAGAVLSAALIGALVFWVLSPGSGPRAGPKTAAIVDQLGVTQPNPAFAKTARNMLEQAGYLVDGFEGEEITVEFYSGLPLRDYDLVILRVHSGLAEFHGELTDYVGLFSGEPYSERKYAKEEATGIVGRATYYESGPAYFGIGPDFIESGMTGKLHGATIIMMGCDGLKSDMTAQAFIRKGAKVVVGWSGPVSARHTDAATELLLRHLLLDGLTVREAVARTMAEAGPDPEYDSELLMYPRKG